MDSHIRIGVIIRVNQQTNLIPHTEEKIMWLLFAFASSLFAALTSILAKIGIGWITGFILSVLFITNIFEKNILSHFYKFLEFICKP